MPPGNGPLTSIVILGAGYTGRHLLALATAKGLPVLASSRSPHNHLLHIPAPQRIEFDLFRPVTWRNVPGGAQIIWCFPAAPLNLVAAFAEQIAPHAGRLIVLGSTSAYKPTGTSDTWLDESSAIDQTLPRVQGEEHLRLNHRAIILRVAGIYGPGRNVLDWIRRGRVGPSPRYVNLIHVEDLAGICLLALERARPGEVYNVSDRQPRQWSEICEVAQRRWNVTPLESEAHDRRGKRISIAKLRTELGDPFTHPDLYAALDELESAEAQRALE
ncbi:MAG: hypothetical protein EPO64_02365 [Nitrospirae bacterium]|nr:MAG: hypothetical protein EPO64_02365 [Nitrospirota bacterium]